MSSRNSFLVCASILIGCVLIAIVPQLFGQPREGFQTEIGRYEADAVSRAGGGATYLLWDTSTGECWFSDSGNKFRPIGKPTRE